MSSRSKILIFRFSALGDVAMTVPVIWSLLQQYPEYYIVFVSRPFAQKFFTPIDRVQFVSVDFSGKHNGLKGLYQLFKRLRELGPFSLVADLHGVLRSYVLGAMFRLTGAKVLSIDKGRKDKMALCRKENKHLVQLKPTFERYRDVFIEAGMGFPFVTFPGRAIYSSDADSVPHDAFKNSCVKIGVAPFAKHQWKMWPIERMRQLVETLDGKGYQVFLFGGRGEEETTLEEWASEYVNVHCLAGQLSMDEELKAIANLDLMVSMDSANMHLASLVETPVISVWGATHPYAGFYGWGQNTDNAVQIDLECRPCSVFGNKPCFRGDFACMESVSVEMVDSKIEQLISLKK